MNSFSVCKKYAVMPEHRNVQVLMIMLEWRDAKLMAECTESINSRLVGLTCGRCYSKIGALQEASMKDWVSQAGMLSGAGFAFGASSLNLSSWKQDKQSAMLFLVPAT